MLQREKQTEWFVSLIKKSILPNKKVYILGKSFKPETNITTGSPSILLKNILKEKKINPICFDPYIDKKKPKFKNQPTKPGDILLLNGFTPHKSTKNLTNLIPI